MTRTKKLFYVFCCQLWVTQKSANQNKITLQIYHSMKFLMTLVSNINYSFNELSHRWRLHWRSNFKSFPKSNCVRHMGTKPHTRTRFDRTQNWLHISVPHTAMKAKEAGRRKNDLCLKKHCFLIPAGLILDRGKETNQLSGSVLNSEAEGRKKAGL